MDSLLCICVWQQCSIFQSVHPLHMDNGGPLLADLMQKEIMHPPSSGYKALHRQVSRNVIQAVAGSPATTIASVC